MSPVWVRLVDVSATTSGFYRVAIGGVALAIYLLVSGQRLRLSNWAWKMLLVAAVFYALDLWFWHRSINIVGPGLATLLANFQVFFMMLAGVVLLHQKPGAAQLVAIPLALLGLGLIVGVDWKNAPGDYRLGVIFGLLTAVAYAGYLLTMRLVRAKSEHKIPSREIAVMSIAVAVMLAASAAIEGESLAIPSLTDAGWLAGYGLLSHALGLMFIASSLPQVSTTEAGLALLLQPTLSFIWDILLFARPMTVTEILGATLALFAIYLGARRPSKQP
ncbi:MAG: DMT family transporter [Gammaproteobacteria bacterium]|nr:DMT family transporter [Gammaproteobacteria bacterium]NNC76968.1 DMT family transporter [Woeseiaceae bacterium]